MKFGFCKLMELLEGVQHAKPTESLWTLPPAYTSAALVKQRLFFFFFLH